MVNKFDAYTATFRDVTSTDLIHVLASCATGNVEVEKGRGFHRFADRFTVFDACGSFGFVSQGGANEGLYMLEVKGDRTPLVVDSLRSNFPEHSVTRVDSCVDFERSGIFEDLTERCLQVKRKHRVKGSKDGDWEDYPEDGRTLYVGSPRSSTRTRLYEKGKQPENRHFNRPDWVRLEVQVRPKTKDVKKVFSVLSPDEIWGASKWSRELAGLVFKQHVDSFMADRPYKKSDRDTAMYWLTRHYGKHLTSLCNDLGSWSLVGETLGALITKNNKNSV